MNKSESDSNIPIEWFKKNKVIVNPDKFQAIVLNKKSSDLTNIKFQVDNQVIKSLSSVELHFNLQISKFVNLRQIN